MATCAVVDIGAAGQAPSRPELNGKGLVLGRVVDSETDAGLGGFVVAVRSGTSLTSLDMLRTSPDGYFVVRNLPAGTWSFGATGPGYEGSGGPSRSIVVTLADGEKRSDVVVPLRKFGSIGGTVYDEQGDPVVGATVRCLTSALTAAAGGAVVKTDDRGTYRCTDLRPRDYALAVLSTYDTIASPALDAVRADTDNGKSPAGLQTVYGAIFPSMKSGNSNTLELLDTFIGADRALGLPRRENGRVLSYGSQFYPNGTTPQSARLLPLRTGQDITGIDFHLRATPAVTVSGVVTAPEPVNRSVLLRLMRVGIKAAGSDFDVATTISDPRGRFTLPFVPAGQYVLRVSRRVGSAGATPDSMWWSSVPLSVGSEEVANVVVDLRKGLHISGTIVGANRPLPADVLQRLSVTLFAADDRAPVAMFAKADADGHFTTADVAAGLYSLRIAGSGAWSVKAAVVGDRDVADHAIDLTGDLPGVTMTLHDRHVDLRGTVRGADAQPKQLVLVVAFSTDRRMWTGYGGPSRRIKSARTTIAGSYTIPDLPPGEYFVAIADEDLAQDWQLPDNLARMSATARRVTIAEEAPPPVDLVLNARTVRRRGLESPTIEQGNEPHGPYVAESDVEQTPAATRVVGTVVEDGTDRPLRGAAVTLNAPGLRGRTIATDERGNFQFDELTPGRVLLAASKAGYLPIEYGATQPGRPGTPVPVTAGSTASVTIKLTRVGVVSGRVLDDNGRPLPTVLVRVMTLRPAPSGGSELVPVRGAAESRADTLGNYRIHGLPPGEYYVAAVPDYAGAGFGARQVTDDELRWAREQLSAPASATDISKPAEPVRGRNVIYGATLYPSARDAGTAAPVKLAAGEERGGVDIRVSLVPSVKVTAVAFTPDGAKGGGVVVRLTLTDRTAVTSPPNGSGAQRTTPDGTAVFNEVTPGLYDVIAVVTPTTQPGSAPVGLWAQTSVTITDRDTDVTLGLQPALSVSGRVVFDGAPPASLSALRVSLANPSTSGATSIAPSPLGTDGRFTIGGVTPGDYRVSVAGLPKPWSPQSAVAGDADLLDALLTLNADKAPEILVTMTERPAELSGSFVDASGRPAPEYSVVLVSADARYWVRGSRRVQAVRPSLDGNFAFTGLPPGDYGLCAFTDFEPGDLSDTEFLRRALSQAVRVSIAAGETKVQNLRVSGGF